ncbi:MAG: hypothetical protein IKG93_03590 [Clostridiales bacterium]|nr:hypothetical protein [Clostridiales bacterium]
MIQKNDFARFIREKRREYNELHQQQLSTRKIANILGMSESSFPKVLNRERPTKHRDVIIAIGIILELLPGEVSEALRLYDMPELEDQRKLSGEEVDRDRILSRMMICCNSKKQSCSLQQVDEQLINSGFRPLSIEPKVDLKNGTKDVPFLLNW